MARKTSLELRGDLTTSRGDFTAQAGAGGLHKLAPAKGKEGDSRAKFINLRVYIYIYYCRLFRQKTNRVFLDGAAYQDRMVLLDL